MKINIRTVKSFKNSRNIGPTFNSHFFDKGINSPTHAWLLGLAYGDGSVSAVNGSLKRFELTLQFGDLNVLEKVRSQHILRKENGISIKWMPSATLRNRPHTTFCVYDSHFATQLNNLGCAQTNVT